jgi:hypothetical protein
MSSPNAGARRGLRDHPLGRVLILVTLLVVAGVVARSCTGSDTNVSKDEAIEIAREVLIFDAESVQVRFVRQGIPTQGFWYVSFYNGSARAPTIVQLVKIDADSGDVLDDGLKDEEDV